MEPEFWHAKWRVNEIGFHQAEIHPLLLAQWPPLALAPGSRVLAPLCGKSHDLIWLRNQGYIVIGIELSSVAVEALFTEHGLTPTRASSNFFDCYSVPGLTVYCGDFFAASPTIIAPCQGFYDRAALIALAPSQRQAYVEHVTELCGPAARGLLITVEYPNSAVKPPPFSVDQDDVRNYYGSRWQVTERVRHKSDIKGYIGEEVAYELLLGAAS
jgi:thiopurine S-methyltransferase